jgi:hypothetical protein
VPCLYTLFPSRSKAKASFIHPTLAHTFRSPVKEQPQSLERRVLLHQETADRREQGLKNEARDYDLLKYNARDLDEFDAREFDKYDAREFDEHYAWDSNGLNAWEMEDVLVGRRSFGSRFDAFLHAGGQQKQY